MRLLRIHSTIGCFFRTDPHIDGRVLGRLEESDIVMLLERREATTMVLSRLGVGFVNNWSLQEVG